MLGKTSGARIDKQVCANFVILPPGSGRGAMDFWAVCIKQIFLWRIWLFRQSERTLCKASGARIGKQVNENFVILPPGSGRENDELLGGVFRAKFCFDGFEFFDSLNGRCVKRPVFCCVKRAAERFIIKF